MAVETLLTQRFGPVAGKLHTARSRNDQVATDIRLYVRDAIADTQAQARALQQTLITHAEQHLDTLLPGMTHLQHAQPVRLAHHLLAYFWMLARDDERLSDAARRADRLPLGAGALAGTTFPINRQQVADELGFAGVVANSLDAVSDRDFAIESVSALSILMMHLSRLSEELILVELARLRVGGDGGQRDDGEQHHAAKEEPGRRRTDARQGGPRVSEIWSDY